MKNLTIIFFILISTTLLSEDLSLCLEAWNQTQSGNHKKALELFKQGIEKGNLSKASLARTYRNMGIASNRSMQFKNAIQYYNKALDLKPDDSWHDYVNRGNAWSGLGKYEKAIADYNRALKLKPNYNEAYYNRGVVFEKQNNKEAALKEFQKAYQYGLRSQLLYDRFVSYGLIKQPEEIQLPPPPEDFNWVRCPLIKGALLCPKKWHHKRSVNGETLGYFITKENIDKKGEFTTGLSVNVIPNITKKKNITPYEYACNFRDGARKIYRFTKEWDKDMGPFKSLGFVYEKKDKAGAFTVHNLLIANNKTGTLYLVMFEAPSAEWEKTWKTAEPMLKYLYIDDTI